MDLLVGILSYAAIIVFMVLVLFIWLYVYQQSTYNLPFESIEEFRQKLVDVHIATESELIGCTAEELKQIMQNQGVTKLPRDYEQFLTIAGKSAGKLIVNPQIYYPALLNNKAIAEKMLQKSLPDDVFVFSIVDHEILDDNLKTLAESKLIIYFHTLKRDNPYIESIVVYDGEMLSNSNSFLHFLAERFILTKDYLKKHEKK